MANPGTFRSALNGFNRQDVAEYLESAAARYNALKEEKNALAEQCASLAAKLSDCEPAVEQLHTAEAAFAEKQAEAEALSNELAALRSENRSLLERLNAAEEQLVSSKGKAQEYDNLLERLSTLEVDASRRAVEIERSAEAHAMEVRQAAVQEASAFRLRREEQMRSFQASLSRVAVSTGLSARLLTGELNQLIGSMQEIVSSLEASAAAFDPESGAPAMPEAVPEAEMPTEPQPLPESEGPAAPEGAICGEEAEE